MPRQKTMSTKKMIELFNEFHAQFPRTKYKASTFGKYLRDRGYEISDKSIRRNDEFREYVESVCTPENGFFNDHVVFVTLDPEKFIEHNNSKAKMMEALMERDRYYANIAANATASIQKRKEYEEMLDKLEEEKTRLSMKVENLERQLESTKEQLNAQIARNAKANEVVGKMIDLIEGYIYPDTANMFFQKEGIFDYVSTIMSDSVVDMKTITPDDPTGEEDVTQNPEPRRTSQFESVNSLLGGFDDD